MKTYSEARHVAAWIFWITCSAFAACAAFVSFLRNNPAAIVLVPASLLFGVLFIVFIKSSRPLPRLHQIG